MVLGGVLWTEEQLYAKVAAKYGVPVVAVEPEPQPQPEPEPEPLPAADAEWDDDAGFGFGDLGATEEETTDAEAEVLKALEKDAKAINQKPVWMNSQAALWFMQTDPDDKIHALQQWEHTMERYRQRCAHLYFNEQFVEALAEAEAGLVCIAGHSKPGAKANKQGHAGATGGGIRKELLDSAARCAIALGKGQAALEHTDDLLTSWPKLVAKDFGFWLLRGKCFVAMKNWAGASDMYCKAVTLRPTNYSGWVALTSLYKAASSAPPPSADWDPSLAHNPDGSPSKWRELDDHSKFEIDGAALKWRLCASASARVRRAFLRYSSRDAAGELVSPDLATVGVISLHAVKHSDPAGGGPVTPPPLVSAHNLLTTIAIQGRF